HPYINLGVIAIEKMNYDKAITYCTKALELDSTFGIAMYHLARAYEKKDNRAHAKFWYQKTQKYPERISNKILSDIEAKIQELK
ncbi:MAG: hypothetical protein KGZ86_03215, partial [Candidatus Latescibacteria bacterium]|nr:hypothetical protein [Candidatus Latescibacterota bacterium]